MDWIQLVQMGRRDAVVSVQTYDGKEGTLWCRDGDIIDAACDGLVGEAAVFLALSWHGGRVLIDFESVNRRRQIQTTTAGLMLKAVYRRDSGVHEIGQLMPPVNTPLPGTLGVGVGTGMVRSGISGEGSGEHLADRVEPFVEPFIEPFPDPFAEAPRTLADLRSISWRFAVAGGLFVLLLFVGLYWKWAYAARSQGVATETPISDLRVVVPPRQRVRLPPVENTATVRPSATVPVQSVRKQIAASAPSATGSGVPARRRVATVVAKRSSATSSTIFNPKSFDGTRTAAPVRSSKVEIIRERQPRIQIIQGQEPESKGQGQPRIQIIDDGKPRIQAVD